jgi:hypothetical protein
MSSPSLSRRRPLVEHPLLVIERILRNREGVWQQISTEYRIGQLIVQMLISSTFAMAIYGIVLGSSNSTLQAISSAIKLPILFLLTLAICLPTLYLFNLVFGARLSIAQALALVLTAMTVTAMLTLAFAPISIFFLITAPDYDFFKLLNVAILTITGSVGLNFLISGMRRMNVLNAAQAVQTSDQSEQLASESGMASQECPVSMGLIYLWVLLYGFVGTQLAWTLRPFFGDPEQSFAIFRTIKGNFYVNIVRSLANLFS